jgi:hypothetical protein
MRIRKPKTRKFYAIPGNDRYYFELRTINNDVREKALSNSIEQTMKQPLSDRASEQFKKADEIEVTHKTRADLMIKSELLESVVGYIMPDDEGGEVRSKDSNGISKSPEDMYQELYNSSDNELQFYIRQAMDVMFGDIPEGDDLARLNKMGITLEMMGFKEADTIPLEENPTTSGDSA